MVFHLNKYNNSLCIDLHPMNGCFMCFRVTQGGIKYPFEPFTYNGTLFVTFAHLFVLKFNAILTTKVISWRSVKHLCVSWPSQTSTATVFHLRVIDYFLTCIRVERRVIHDTKQDIISLWIHDTRQYKISLLIHDTKQDIISLWIHDTKQDKISLWIHDTKQDIISLWIHDTRQYKMSMSVSGNLFLRIDDNLCYTIHTFLTTDHCFDDGNVGKQPMGLKEYCVE